jgi:hypothetical protein
MPRERPAAWRCRHLYPISVEGAGGAKRARCLGCGEVGPVRAEVAGAMWALRDEARYGDKGEPDLGRRYGGPIRQSRSGAAT